MSSMRKLSWGLVALALIAWAVPNLSQPQSPGNVQAWPELERLDKDVRVVVVTWLSRDCEAKEGANLLEQFWSVGNELQPVFREAYRQGPPPQVVDEARKAAASAFDQRQAWLQEEGEDLMSAEEVQRQLAIPSGDYIQRRIEDVGIGWRERALIALGLVGDDETLDELLRLAESDSPGAAAAARALEEREAMEDGGGFT
ncbi:MAG: hypothetical protein AAF481_07960 [Acidobacteriota bacterium]